MATANSAELRKWWTEQVMPLSVFKSIFDEAQHRWTGRISAIYLAGSRAKRLQRLDSDYDIFVVVDDYKKLTELFGPVIQHKFYIDGIAVEMMAINDADREMKIHRAIADLARYGEIVYIRNAR